MRVSVLILPALVLSISGIVLGFARIEPQTSHPAAVHSYVGFDRNEYPGDESLPLLRKSYSFVSYWLSPPPGAKSNSWIGKRGVMQSQGFGFLLLYQGRTSSQLPYKKDSIEAGLADARAAAAAARRDGFPEGSVIFLDVEEGGRFFEGYLAYLQSWAESLRKEKFHPGIYCSGIVVDEGEGSTIISSDDIRAHIGVPEVVYWIYNDACPPSPGCSIPQNPPAPSASGVAYASVWQYVRSPREKKVARHCRGYAEDGKCYAPGDAGHRWFLDENVATTPDPSAPR
ncbi:MAG TPA: glycoside hydrolase domain-containing protein [Candidatus Limnocylindrales bacterium]|nr:glycoside hydrolase domain-containing protein [Candidatus Limnocylindrales bacterium]